MIDWLISVGDATSQLVGRFIPIYYEGQWHTFTRTSNESISGAAHWHSEQGRCHWVSVVIDFLLFPWEEDHCLKSRKADRSRAGRLLSKPIL